MHTASNQWHPKAFEELINIALPLVWTYRYIDLHKKMTKYWLGKYYEFIIENFNLCNRRNNSFFFFLSFVLELYLL